MPTKCHFSFVFLAFVLLLGVQSCGVKKKLVLNEANTNVLTSLSAKAVIKNHYAGAAAFKTLSGRMKIDYASGNTEQGIPATFRMEKDKAIWISVFFGMGKAYITPDKVSFYSSVNNISFEGDFKVLSAYVGTPLDFNMIQGLLLGDSALDLKAQKYRLDQTPGVYRLKPQRAMAFFKLFVDIDPSHFKVIQTQISQSSENSSLSISYPAYEKMDGLLLPSSIDVKAQMGATLATVAISYKNISVNRPLNFPFKIPNGLKSISLPEHAE
jgi:hypothetical protein